MGMAARVRGGLAIGRRGVATLFDRPVLLAFPLLSTVTLGTLGLVVLLAVPIEVMVPRYVAAVGRGGGLILLAAVLAVAVVVTTISTFFSAALVHAVWTAFEGGPPGVRAGLAAAWEVKWVLLLWGVLAATVSPLLRALERSDRAGVLVRGLLGLPWTAATYFVVPATVIERTGPRGTFATSLRAVRDTWGEGAGSVGLGVAVSVVVLPVLGVGAPAVVFLSLRRPRGGLIALPVVGVLLLLYPATQAVTAVVRTALYRYARDGHSPGAFEDLDLGDALG